MNIKLKHFGFVAMLLAQVILPAGSVGATPNFKAPWSCGVAWHASTYPGHVANAIDFNDFPDEVGQPVLASASGTVTTQDSSAPYSYGNMVKIDHGGGWETRYAHLQSFAAMTDRDPSVEGLQVIQGEVIGYAGGTESPGGNHLHYEQRLHDNGQTITFDGVIVSAALTNSPSPSDPEHTSTNCGGTPSVADVWGLTSAGQVYRYDGSSFVNVAGTLADIDVASDGTLWGVAPNGQVFHYTNNQWVNVPGTLAKISAGGGAVWGLDTYGNIYKLVNGSFQNISGKLADIDVNDVNGLPWGVASNGQVFHYNGTTWQAVSGTLSQISVHNNVAWGLDSNGYVYKRAGQSWVNIPGRLARIDVDRNGTLWGVAPNGQVFHYTNNQWVNVPGTLARIGAR